MRSRILNASVLKLGLAVLFALCLVSAVGVLASSSQHGRAAADSFPAAGPVGAKGNIPCSQENTRFTATFDDQCPKGFMYTQVKQRDVEGLVATIASLEARIDALEAAAKPKVTPTPSVTTPAGVEKAPVLSLNGAATDDVVRLKWTDATPDAGETVATYVIQQKVVGSTWVTAAGSPQAESPLAIAGLDANTSYVFRVRAEYASDVDGLWSNELTVKTALAAVASPEVS